jgi:hypothetical protein
MKNRDAYRFEDDDIARDGETVRRPMLLMDSDDSGRVTLTDTFKLDRPVKIRDLELHKPGYRTLDARKRKPPDDEDEDEDDIDDVRAPSIKARDAYVRSLSDAWPSPPPTRFNARTVLPARLRGPLRGMAGSRMTARLSGGPPRRNMRPIFPMHGKQIRSRPPWLVPTAGDPQALGENWRGGR